MKRIIVIAFSLFFLASCSPDERAVLAEALLPFEPLLRDEPGQLVPAGRQASYAALFDQALEIAGTHPKDLVSVLIHALDDQEFGIYYTSAYILRHLTQTSNGFQVYSSTADRRKAAIRWKTWWQENKLNFRSQAPVVDGSTLIVDEIPGRLVGNDDEPPGRLLHLSASGEKIVDIYSLKMPYDAVRNADGNYFVNIIRERAVFTVNTDGDVLGRIEVGGYPCSLQLLQNGNLLVAGWDDDVPGFVREFDAGGNIVWSMEDLQWPWKASRLSNGNTLIGDAGTKRVFEVTADGKEIWAVENLGPEVTELFDSLGPVYLQRLDDGNTLVSIRGTSQIQELDGQGNVVWEIGPELVKNQYSAERLWKGNTLIADSGNFRVMEINVAGEIVWSKGGIGYPAKAYRY